jgi:hypothetical protein
MDIYMMDEEQDSLAVSPPPKRKGRQWTLEQRETARLKALARGGKAKKLRLPPERAGEPLEYIPVPISQPSPLPDDDPDPETAALIADGILTREEVTALRVEAAAKVAADQKAAKKKALLAKFSEDERRRAGLIAPAAEQDKWLNEIVIVNVTLPALKPAPGQGGPILPDPITLDGRPFYHGRSYEVPRVVALTLYDQMGRLSRHAAQVAGESPAYYNSHRGIYSQAGEVLNWRPN